MILGKGIGDLYVPILFLVLGDPEGEDGAHAIRLGFEGIGVEGGGIVSNLQVVQPVQVADHGGGAEPYGAPILQIMVNPDRPSPKDLPRPIIQTVMQEAMNRDLKAPPLEAIAKLRGHGIPLGHEAERGAEAQLLLQLYQLPAFLMPLGGFHIVGKDQRKFLALRPSGPPFRGTVGPFVDGPDVRATRAFLGHDDPAQLDLETAGDQGLEEIIKMIEGHRITGVRDRGKKF